MKRFLISSFIYISRLISIIGFIICSFNLNELIVIHNGEYKCIVYVFASLTCISLSGVILAFSINVFYNKTKVPMTYCLNDHQFSTFMTIAFLGGMLCGFIALKSILK